MRDLGFRVVRFFLLTEDFLPGPMTVDPDKVAQLVQVARIASEEKVSTIPTLITINMSGKMWWPAWMRDENGAPRSLYSDPHAASLASAAGGGHARGRWPAMHRSGLSI